MEVVQRYHQADIKSTLLILDEFKAKGKPSPSEAVKKLAVRIVTDALLEDTGTDALTDYQQTMIQICWELETYDSTRDPTLNSNLQASQALAMKHSHIFDKITASKLDAVRYASKRIPCHCLQALHQQLKDQPRIRQCDNCGKAGPRGKLLMCSRCHLADYCSKECQRLSWRVHKIGCDIAVENNKNNKATTTTTTFKKSKRNQLKKTTATKSISVE